MLKSASAIICHHTHVVSSHEVYNGVPIFYGLGNFVYPIQYEEVRNYTLITEFLLTIQISLCSYTM